MKLQTLFTSLLISVMTILLLSVFLNFNLVSSSLGTELLQTNEVSTQSANAVTSVVTYFRGFDTLGEVTILFLSIFGIGLGLEGYQKRLNIFAYENQLLKIAVDVLFPLIVLFGVYIIVHGHLSPGGGFQGGVIIASAFLLKFLANNDKFSLNHKMMQLLESLSGAGFILMGLLGLLLVNRFFDNFLPLGKLGDLFSGGIIPLIYLFVGIKVAAEITALVEYFIRIKDGRIEDVG